MAMCGESNKLATDDDVDDEDDDTDNAFFMTWVLTTAMPHKWQNGLALNNPFIENTFGHRGKTGRVMPVMPVLGRILRLHPDKRCCVVL